MFDRDFDGSRLQYHPAAVAHWLEHGTSRGPLYTELELTARCNCRCSFCGVDHLVNQTGDTLAAAVARRALDELNRLGNRSVMIAGHGESLLHEDAEEIVAYSAVRMSTSVTTNGICLGEARLGLVDPLKWLRFSVNGHDAETYAAVHGTRPEVFAQVMRNLEETVRRKRDRGLKVTVGVQLVLLDQNASGVPSLARRVRDVGADYFSVKPYSRHPLARHRLTIDYGAVEELERELRTLDGKGFRIVFRSRSFSKIGQAKPYPACYGTNFIAFISASGDVWACNVFAGDPRFRLGNVAQESLADMWNGPRRAAVRRYVEEEMDLAGCRDVCRMDACNGYLWRLKHPLEHDDFI